MLKIAAMLVVLVAAFFLNIRGFYRGISVSGEYTDYGMPFHWLIIKHGVNDNTGSKARYFISIDWSGLILTLIFWCLIWFLVWVIAAIIDKGFLKKSKR